MTASGIDKASANKPAKTSAQTSFILVCLCSAWIPTFYRSKLLDTSEKQSIFSHWSPFVGWSERLSISSQGAKKVVILVKWLLFCLDTLKGTKDTWINMWDPFISENSHAALSSVVHCLIKGQKKFGYLHQLATFLHGQAEMHKTQVDEHVRPERKITKQAFCGSISLTITHPKALHPHPPTQEHIWRGGAKQEQKVGLHSLGWA